MLRQSVDASQLQFEEEEESSSSESEDETQILEFRNAERLQLKRQPKLLIYKEHFVFVKNVSRKNVVYCPQKCKQAK